MIDSYTPGEGRAVCWLVVAIVVAAVGAIITWIW